MKKTLVAMLLSSALSLMPLPSAADEAEAKRQLETVATGLVASLPTGKKVVLKTISPEQSGLPEDFLGKLTSDLEAALLVASEFEIDLINRQTTEEIWAEAIEFNNAEFDALHAASGADVALMLDARATEAGVEIAVTAYSLDSAEAGKVLASSGSTVLALDMQQNIGVDVNSLNDQMAQVLAEIEKVGQTGGLISDPNTYAEYYHNARILQQRGEVDLAMQSYEAALAEGYLFVDPVFDLFDLAQSRYGESGARSFFEKKVIPKLPRELAMLAELISTQDTLKYVNQVFTGEITFPPFLVEWLNSRFKSGVGDSFVVSRASQKATEIARISYESGEFQNFFIDKIRAAAFGEQVEYQTGIESDEFIIRRETVTRVSARLRSTAFPSSIVEYVYSEADGGNVPATNKPAAGTFIESIDIQDAVLAEKSILLCASKADGSSRVCKDISPLSNVFSDQVNDWWGGQIKHANGVPTTPVSLLSWTIGLPCIESLTYTDVNGFELTVPVALTVYLSKMEAETLEELRGCSSNLIIEEVE